MTHRPPTSKPRGVCRYYTEPRGCFAGDKCKFLHSSEPEAATTQLTPYDQAKTCRYYAAGFCRREDKCWFLHVKPMTDSRATEEDEDLCSICFERPLTFGLLSGCSHVFCIKCIRLWRDPSGKSEDVKWSGVTKRCPMCRTPSKFITPSSIFYKHGDPLKDQAMETYKASMARVPCRYFLQSKARNPDHPMCPFGRDCFYEHLNDDGSAFAFSDGVERSMMNYRRSRAERAGSSRTLYTDIISYTLEGILPSVPEQNHALFREGLGLLSDMFSPFYAVAALAGNDSQQQSEFDEMPELECADDTSSDGAFSDDSEDEQKDEHGDEHGNNEHDEHIDEHSDERPPFVTDGRGRVIGAADHVVTSFPS